MIPYGQQRIDSSDIQAVVRVLKSSRLTQGPLVEQFETNLATYCQSKYAATTSSGTAALHLACLTAGVGPGDEVVTTPISFLATANSILYTGAKPVFADIDKSSGNLCADSIQKVLTSKTKAILVVHLAGLSANMVEINHLAKKKGLIVIEDACHALGAGFQGHPVGSCRYSDMTIFSFHPVKLITTGEGGAITTNRSSYFNRIKLLRSHGMIRSPKLQKKMGGWYYQMTNLGFNYRLTDIQSALGISQLEKADSFVALRTKVAQNYHRQLSGLGSVIQLPDFPKDRRHAWHLFLLRTTSKSKQWTRLKLYNYLHAAGIQTQVHYIPIYRQPYYQKHIRVNPKDYPNAEKFYREVLSLPIFPHLSIGQQAKVVKVIRSFFGCKFER